MHGYRDHLCVLGLISPTFYAQLLHTQVALAAFLCLHFRFVLYRRKTIGAKVVRRTLVKLTPGSYTDEPLGADHAVEKDVAGEEEVGQKNASFLVGIWFSTLQQVKMYKRVIKRWKPIVTIGDTSCYK